jgi:NAD+ synthase
MEHDELAIDASEAAGDIEAFIAEAARRAGFERVILGLSGGLDSAVVCALCARAMGARRVIAAMMPYAEGAQSVADARSAAACAGVEPITVEITAQLDAYFARFPDADARRRGNKMARERMSILYDLSAAYGALVVGTSNKTEWLLGYFTLWGDMAAGIWPLAALYKTQVRQLAAHLGVPEAIRGKPPSADLWEGQTDEGELGMRYEEVDRVLHHLVDLGEAPAHLVKARFPRALVERVAELVERTRYKRRLPLTIDVAAEEEEDFI